MPEAKKALLERFKSQPGPGDKEYEERQAQLKAIAEARRQREDAAREAEGRRGGRRAEAARLKAEAEADAAREAAASRESRPRKRHHGDQLKAEEDENPPRCSPSRRPRATPATRRARRRRKRGSAGTERRRFRGSSFQAGPRRPAFSYPAQNSTSSSSTSSGSSFASSIHSFMAGSARMAAQ